MKRRVNLKQSRQKDFNKRSVVVHLSVFVHSQISTAKAKNSIIIDAFLLFNLFLSNHQRQKSI